VEHLAIVTIYIPLEFIFSQSRVARSPANCARPAKAILPPSSTL